MKRASASTEPIGHPDWCSPDRCGYLVPPVMSHMARRHRGVIQRVGDHRSSGLVVTYLIGADALGPMVAVHATCRAGKAWAELSLPQVAQLIEQLRALLAQVGDRQGGGR
ncbi:hypothetical protein ACFY3U_04575 [Micromonospora sp. NPDC000089]|uniref:hypothetical protein n=1 Tax=unclassified Micromonospora TaxID=2617518 RepID=UPI00369C667F